MDNNEKKIIIEIYYNNKYFTIESSNIITIEELKKQAIEKFNLENNQKNCLSLTYKDEDGDINIIATKEDILESAKEITPNNYYSKINLEILPYLDERISTQKNKSKKITDKELTEKRYEEENKKLKIELEQLKEEKNKEIKELKNIAEKNRKEITELKKFKEKYKDIKSKDGTDEKNIEKIINDLFNKEKENFLNEIKKLKEEGITSINEQIKKNNKNLSDIKEKDNIKEINVALNDILNKLNFLMNNLSNDRKNAPHPESSNIP